MAKIISINAHFCQNCTRLWNPGGESTCKAREDSENKGQNPVADTCQIYPSTFKAPAFLRSKHGVSAHQQEIVDCSLFEGYPVYQTKYPCKTVSRWFEYTEKTPADNSAILLPMPFYSASTPTQ